MGGEEASAQMKRKRTLWGCCVILFWGGWGSQAGIAEEEVVTETRMGTDGRSGCSLPRDRQVGLLSPSL